MNPRETAAPLPLGAAVEAEPLLSPNGLQCLRGLASRYVWWKTPDEAMRFPGHVAAQVMKLGTWSDLTSMAESVGETYLRHVLRHAEAGQLDARSWHYWHYRLRLAEYGKKPVPPLPLRKTA